MSDQPNRDGRGLTPFEFALAGVEPPDEATSASLEIVATMRQLAASVPDAEVTNPGLDRFLTAGAPRRRRPVRPRPARPEVASTGAGTPAAGGGFVDITPDDLQPGDPSTPEPQPEVAPPASAPAGEALAGMVSLSPLTPPDPPPTVAADTESEPLLAGPPDAEAEAEPVVEATMADAGLEAPPTDTTDPAGPVDDSIPTGPIPADAGPAVPAEPTPPTAPPIDPDRPVPGEPNESLVARVLAAQEAEDAAVRPETEPEPSVRTPDGETIADPPPTPAAEPRPPRNPVAPVAAAPVDETWSEIDRVRADLRALTAAGAVGAEDELWPDGDEVGLGAPVGADEAESNGPESMGAEPMGAAPIGAEALVGAGTPSIRPEIPMTQVGPPADSRRTGRTRRLLLSSGALVAVVGLAALGWWWWAEQRSSDEDALSTRTITEASSTTTTEQGGAADADRSSGGGSALIEGTSTTDGSGSATELSVSTSSTGQDGGQTTSSTSSTATTVGSTTSPTSAGQTTTETSETTQSTTTTTEPTTTEAPALAYIGDRVSLDGYEGPGLAGVSVSLWEDGDGDGTGDRLVSSTTTNGDGRYYFDQAAGCYEVRFQAPSGYFIRSGFERQSLCLAPGESAARVDAIAEAEVRAAGPTGCLVERPGGSFNLGVEVYESRSDWADSYTFRNRSGGVVARTRDLGAPDDIDNSGDHEWWGQANGFDHRDVWSVSAERGGSESDPVACQRISED